MNTPESKPLRSKRSAVAAMLLGTALTAWGGGSVARADAPEAANRIVNDMSRYCSACWRNAGLHPDYWSDCTQDVFQRLLQRVEPEEWGQALRGDGEEHREFLRAIDAVKKRMQRARRQSAGMVDLVPDHRDSRNSLLADQREAIRLAAAEVLSPRQQRILQMSFEGWSVGEIAAKLGHAPERVSDEKYKAIQKLRLRLAEVE